MTGLLIAYIVGLTISAGVGIARRAERDTVLLVSLGWPLFFVALLLDFFDEHPRRAA